MRLRFFLFFICSFSLFAHEPKPVETPAQTVKEDKGQEIYEQFCITCHQEGVAGAPKIHQQTDWDKHKKSISQLVDSAMNGINNMPAQGTCYECTKEDLKAAIQYMLPHHD